MGEENGKLGNQNPTDDCLIYYSKTNNCWIAHGLCTDQIGTGVCVLDAYVDYLTNIDHLLELQKREKDIQVSRLAPNEILKRAEKAPLLPKELYEVAHKKVRGDWPQYLKILMKPAWKRSLKVRVCQFV